MKTILLSISAIIYIASAQAASAQAASAQAALAQAALAQDARSERAQTEPAVHPAQPAYLLAQAPADSARYECDSITIAEYVGLAEYLRYSDPKKYTPTASFRVLKILKGPPFPGNLAVKFNDEVGKIGDGARKPVKAQAKTQAVKLDESMMPKKGSRWILFIRSAVAKDGKLETFQGRKGMVEYNRENLDKALHGVEGQLYVPWRSKDLDSIMKQVDEPTQ